MAILQSICKPLLCVLVVITALVLGFRRLHQDSRNLDTYVSTLQYSGDWDPVIEAVDVSGDTAYIEVSDTWHQAECVLQLKATQVLYHLWFLVPNNDCFESRLVIVDEDGHALGGSSEDQPSHMELDGIPLATYRAAAQWSPSP